MTDLFDISDGIEAFPLDAFAEIKDEMRAVYLNDDRPWLVGFSGGKDSTLLLTLVAEMILQLPPSARRKRVIVVSSDTGVENPIFQRYMHRQSALIGERLSSYGIESRIVKADADHSFWSCLIGLGYQVPEMPYIRWCTGNLKIQPMNRFLSSVIKESGSGVIQLFGVRAEESVARKRRLSKEEIEGKVLVPNKGIIGAWDYNPLRKISTEQVWGYLLRGDARSPWGEDNRFLYGLYQGEEMPEESSVLGHSDDSRLPVQGNTRFGCWCCTVAAKDMSIQNFVDKGYTELKPLRDFRQWLVSVRNDPQYKDWKSRKGDVRDEEGRTKGFGTFSLYGRETILRKLLELEEESGFSIITEDELRFIESAWIADGDITRRRLVNAFYDVKGRRLSWDAYRVPMLEDEAPARELADRYSLDYDFFCRALSLVESSLHKARSAKLSDSFDSLLAQEWVTHKDVAAAKEGLER